MSFVNTSTTVLLKSLFIATIFMACFLFSLTASATQYEIVINKSKQELIVKNGHEIIKHYQVSHGRGGKGTKHKLGDNKTPVGVYKIMNFKSNSRFHFFMQLDYPNLLDAWSGYKNKTITAKEFDTIATAISTLQKPPQNTILGGYIGIHGLGEENPEKISVHKSSNWTEGCIALTNKEIIELKQFVDIGTKVVIRE